MLFISEASLLRELLVCPTLRDENQFLLLGFVSVGFEWRFEAKGSEVLVRFDRDVDA